MTQSSPAGATMYEPVESVVVTRLEPDEAVHELTLTNGSVSEFEAGARAISRVLSSPTSGEGYFRAPQSGDPIWFAVRYWSGLLHLLMFSLGWPQVGRGLLWLDESRRAEDLRLQLVEEIFEHDGQLDLMRAWLWDTDGQPDGLWTHPWETAIDWKPKALALPDDKIAWSRSIQQTAMTYPPPFPAAPNPLNGVLHLGNYAAEPLNGRSRATASHADTATRRAFLILEGFEGWYLSLKQFGESLTPHPKGSWYIDVYLQNAGFFGTYRRSAKTNLWFGGHHRFHEQGA